MATPSAPWPFSPFQSTSSFLTPYSHSYWKKQRCYKLDFLPIPVQGLRVTRRHHRFRHFGPGEWIDANYLTNPATQYLGHGRHLNSHLYHSHLHLRGGPVDCSIVPRSFGGAKLDHYCFERLLGDRHGVFGLGHHFPLKDLVRPAVLYAPNSLIALLNIVNGLAARIKFATDVPHLLTDYKSYH